LSHEHSEKFVLLIFLRCGEKIRVVATALVVVCHQRSWPSRKVSVAFVRFQTELKYNDNFY